MFCPNLTPQGRTCGERAILSHKVHSLTLPTLRAAPQNVKEPLQRLADVIYCLRRVRILLFLVTAIKHVLAVQRRAACTVKICSVKIPHRPGWSPWRWDSSNPAPPRHEEMHPGKHPVRFLVFGCYLPLLFCPRSSRNVRNDARRHCPDSLQREPSCWKTRFRKFSLIVL